MIIYSPEPVSLMIGILCWNKSVWHLSVSCQLRDLKLPLQWESGHLKHNEYTRYKDTSVLLFVLYTGNCTLHLTVGERERRRELTRGKKKMKGFLVVAFVILSLSLLFRPLSLPPYLSFSLFLHCTLSFYVISLLSNCLRRYISDTFLFPFLPHNLLFPSLLLVHKLLTSICFLIGRSSMICLFL